MTPWCAYLKELCVTHGVQHCHTGNQQYRDKRLVDLESRQEANSSYVGKRVEDLKPIFYYLW